MRKAYGIMSLAILGIFFLSFTCFADQGVSDKYQVRHRLIDNFLERTSDSAKSFFNNFFEGSEIKSFLSLSQGLDNNVRLNSRRDTDTFTQIFFKPTVTTPINENTSRILSYELTGFIYGDESNLNLIINKFNLGMDHKINDDLDFSGQYSLGIIDYPNTGYDDFINHTLDFKIKQKFPAKFYHSLGYNFAFKGYTQKLKRTSSGLNSEDERHDRVNTIGYEIGKYFPKDLVKFSYQYFNNDSNDSYLKYYDYDSFQPGVSLTHFFNKKTFCYTAFSKQMRYFRSRTISRDANFKEWDRTYVGMLGLYYSPEKSFTIGVNYTYRQNRSNEPLENYSGSIVTLNTYYNF